VKVVSQMECVAAINAASYTLGSLSPADRRTYENHLADCAECRREVAHLAVVPGLLARLEPATVRAIVGDAKTLGAPRVTESTLSGVLARARAQRAARRRRRRWQAIGAALTAMMLAARLHL
jgi:anti-sigma factor RsiW